MSHRSNLEQIQYMESAVGRGGNDVVLLCVVIECVRVVSCNRSGSIVQISD